MAKVASILLMGKEIFQSSCMFVSVRNMEFKFSNSRVTKIYPFCGAICHKGKRIINIILCALINTPRVVLYAFMIKIINLFLIDIIKFYPR